MKCSYFVFTVDSHLIELAVIRTPGYSNPRLFEPPVIRTPVIRTPGYSSPRLFEPPVIRTTGYSNHRLFEPLFYFPWDFE